MPKIILEEAWRRLRPYGDSTKGILPLFTMLISSTQQI